MSGQPEPRLPVRLGRWHERWLYTVAAILFASGIGWLIAHFGFAEHGNFGDLPNPTEPWWLRVHGASMMGFLVTLGSLFPGHIARAWRMRRNHRSGLLMLACTALLILTGYGLYYGGDEEARAWISVLHWGVGLAVAGVLTAHVVLGKSRTAPKPTARTSVRLSAVASEQAGQQR